MCTCNFIVVLTCLFALVVGEPRSVDVIQLNSDNWSDSLIGEWFVEFYAPWCPACQGFTAKYEEFAHHAPTYNVKVAKIDITENPALSGRFLVTSLPTLYYLRDGVTRYYTGRRDLDSLLKYLRDEEWLATIPVPWYKAPNSFFMTVVSWFFELSVHIRKLHDMMTEEFGIPVWGSYIIFAIFTLIAGLVLGLALVLLCDVLCPPRQRQAQRVATPDKYDKLAETDEDSEDLLDESDITRADEVSSTDSNDEKSKQAVSTAVLRKRKPRKDT